MSPFAVIEFQERLQELFEKKAVRLAAVLRPPASLGDLEAAEHELGLRLPDDVREAYLWHDGQETHFRPAEGQDPRRNRHPNFFAGLAWCSLEEVLRCWRMNNECLQKLIDDYGPQESAVMSQTQPILYGWWNPAYVPVGNSFCGDCLCIDLAPGPAGSVGQLIEWFNQNSAEHPLLAPSLQHHLLDMENRLVNETMKFSDEIDRWIEWPSGEEISKGGAW